MSAQKPLRQTAGSCHSRARGNVAEAWMSD
jgi:hypothetical protein